MILIAVDIVPAWIGLGCLVGIAAVVIVLQFSAAQRRWAERLQIDRAATAEVRDARPLAHSAGA